jgi:hypothetical protein
MLQVRFCRLRRPALLHLPLKPLAYERFCNDLCYFTRRGNVCTYVLQQQSNFVDAANHVFDLRLLESDVAQGVAASRAQEILGRFALLTPSLVSFVLGCVSLASFR